MGQTKCSTCVDRQGKMSCGAVVLGKWSEGASEAALSFNALYRFPLVEWVFHCPRVRVLHVWAQIASLRKLTRT